MLILLEESWSDKLVWLFPAAILGIALFLFLRYSRKRMFAAGYRGTDEDSERPEGWGPGQASEAQKLFVEIHNFTREVEGRLDTKIAYLKRLISEAESAGEKLDRLIDAAQGPSREDPARRGPSGGGPSGGGKYNPPPAAEVGAAAGNGVGAGNPPPPAGGERGSRIDFLVGEPSSEAADPAGRRKVLDLHGAGKTVQEIVQAVGLPKGEVELIINLLKSEQGIKK